MAAEEIVFLSARKLLPIQNKANTTLDLGGAVQMRSRATVALATVVTAAATVIWSAPARAYVFTFDDEYYITSTTRPFTSVAQNAINTFGTSNGVGAAGIYQGNGNCTPANCLGSTQLMNVGSSSGNLAGEFELNGTTFTNQELALFGFGQSLNNGQQVDTVFNKSIAPFIRYTVGGATTPFAFNSFDARGGSTITVEGALGGSVVPGDIMTITLTSTLTTYTFNWSGIDTIEFLQNGGNLIGTNVITLDNVVINNAAIPEPVSLIMLGSGLLGLAAGRRFVA